MSIIFFGSPAFSVPALEAILSSGETVSAVVTQKDKRRGRGGKLMPSAVKARALELGITNIFEPTSMCDENLIADLSALKPEFLIVVAYGKLLPKELLAIASLAPINLHTSFLPLYRGASPIVWAILNGDKEAGISTMLMSDKLDGGDILLQEGLTINYVDTAGSLSERLSFRGGPLLVKTIKLLREGTLTPMPQQGKSTYAPILKKDDGIIDWSKEPKEIFNFVRAMQPWPGAFCFVGGKRLKILKVRPVMDLPPDNPKAGEVISISNESFFIAASGGMIEVLVVQPEGKKAMPSNAYLQGRAFKVGQVLA
jgi:methionyl-tRNA formyltransferase